MPYPLTPLSKNEIKIPSSKYTTNLKSLSEDQQFRNVVFQRLLAANDVTDDAGVSSGVQQAIHLLDGLDVVVNNAGVGVFGIQEHFTIIDSQRLFDINVFGVQRVNRVALPYLRKQGSGLIIYVSSLLGRMTMPFYGPCNASKWALEALAENYRTELSGFGIEGMLKVKVEA